MSARFVIGRAGSGKTRHCREAIAARLVNAPLGPATFWLLPRSATFQAERELACGLPQLGFFNCQVLSIDSFVQAILDDCGRADVAAITPVGRRMILGYLLQREAEQLRYFRTQGPRDGLVQRLDATLAEIDRAGADEAMLAALMAGNTGAESDPTLSAKLHDLHHLYAAYNTYVGQDRLNPRRRTDELLRRIRGCSLLKDAAIFVDAYTHFSEVECRILATAAQAAARMEITLMMDPAGPLLANPHHRGDEFDLFHRTEEIYRRLWMAMNELGVEVEPPLLLEKRRRFVESPVLAEVEGAVGGEQESLGATGRGTPRPVQAALSQRHRSASTPTCGAQAEDQGQGKLQFIEAPNRAAEVDAAARTIQDWLGQGLRMRGIAVLARDLSAYHEWIAASFAEHGLAWFMDRRRSAGHHPLIQLISGVMDIARDNWPRDAVLAMLKTGLASVSPTEADAIENYVLAHRIRGPGWASDRPWTFIVESQRDEDRPPEPTDLQQELARHIDQLRRRATDPLKPLVALLRGETLTTAQAIAALRTLLNDYAVAQRLQTWMVQATEKEQWEVAAEHQRVWDEALALLDQMEQLLGRETMPPGDFMAILQSALEEFDLALTPPTLDQVLVGQLDRTITPEVDGVIVLGLNEGVFPAAAQEDSILNDADRRTLRDRALNVEPGSRRRLLEERFLGYVAFTRASRRLCLMRPRDDAEGKEAAPSAFWLDLRRRFPDAPLETLPADVKDRPQWIGTPRQLVGGLMRWVRGTERDDGPETGLRTPEPALSAALYQWLAAGDCDHGPIDRLRDQAWGALSYHNETGLSESTARLLFAPMETPPEQASETDGSTLQATAAQLESFAACPFQHFAKYGLKLQERRRDEEVTALDLHHVYHRILRRLVRHLLRTQGDWPQLTSEEGRRLIDEVSHRVGAALKNEWMLSSARNQYLLERIARTVEQVVAHQVAATQRGRFHPAHTETTFGMESSRNEEADKIDGANLPPLVIPTPGGNTLRLRGKMDRVDLLDSGAAVVMDYKLNGRSLVLAEVMHGLALQLLICLMALREGGESLAGKAVTPAAVFYLRLLRQLENVRHPEEAGDPDAPDFHLRIKPRGLLDVDYLPDLDGEMDGGRSGVVSAYIKKDGAPGNIDNTDVVTRRELEALLDHVRTLTGQLADRILKGTIDILPYRMGEVTPCPRCSFRSLCRFDPAMDKYHRIAPMKRSEVLKTLLEEA